MDEGTEAALRERSPARTSTPPLHEPSRDGRTGVHVNTPNLVTPSTHSPKRELDEGQQLDQEEEVDFIDACGLGGQLQGPPTPPPSDRPYPGHRGATCRRSTFDLEQQLVTVATPDNIFAAELQRLIAADDGPFADSDLRLPAWLDVLSRSSSPTQSAHIWWGVSRGFRVLPKGHVRQPTKSPNYFASEHKELAVAEVQRQLGQRFLYQAGPDDEVIDVMPMGSVPKGNKVRIVFNASKGSGNYDDAVNGDIDESFVQLPRLQDALEAVQPFAHIIKGDVSDYFLQLPTRHDQHRHAAVELDGTMYLCGRVPLGYRNSMRIAQAVSVRVLEEWGSAFDAEDDEGRPHKRQKGPQQRREGRDGQRWRESRQHAMARQRRYEDCYCDDFYAVTSGGWSRQKQSRGAAARYLRTWLQLMSDLGLPFDLSKPGKVVAPTQVAEILGVVVDTVAFEVRLSDEKVDKLGRAIVSFLQRDTATLHEVEVLHGKLNWTACVLWGMRLLLFGLRRMLRAGGRGSRQQRRGQAAGQSMQRIAIHPLTRRDLEITKLVLGLQNRRTIRRSMSKRTMPFDLHSDGSLWGGGCWFGGHYIAPKWTTVLESKDMGYSEARALKAGLDEWAFSFAGHSLHVYVDNQGLYHLLRGSKLSSPDPRLQNEMVEISLILMAFKIDIIVHWFEGALNIYADLASRLHHPVKGVQHQQDLDKLVTEWRRENTAWRWKHTEQRLSETEQHECDVGLRLLTEWRQRAAATM